MKNKVINLFGNKPIPNTETSYSKLLEKFMANFEEELKIFEYLEDIIDFAINAWNFANMKMILPKNEVDKIINTAKEDKIKIDLLLKMIDYKIKKFKEHTNFIVDFELNETDGDPVLTVVTEDKETYFTSVFDELETGNTQANYEENYIDRKAIILKPKQPFLDWQNNLWEDDDPFYEDDISEVNTYLIDDEIDDVEKWLKKKFDKFFKLELEEWCEDKKLWPQNRNYKMFNLWFRVEISEMVYDVEKKPIQK